MPIAGRSLVGLMERQDARRYFEERCVLDPQVASSDIDGLVEEARHRVGGPHPRAGHPLISPLPGSLEPYLESVRNSRGYGNLVDSFGDVEFGMVEIGPLLAFQFHVSTDRSDALVPAVPGPMSPERLAEICLPNHDESFSPQVATDSHGVVVHSESLNLRVVRSGIFQPQNGGDDVVAGVYLGMGCPLLHVAEFQGRFYLRNGFHRVYALQEAGVSEVPCAIVRATRFEDTGALGNPETFSREKLESDSAPTCWHYADERSYPVAIRQFWRVITVSWSEAVFSER